MPENHWLFHSHGRQYKSPKYGRRHYEEMADMARTHGDPTLIDKMVETFKSDNPRFQEDRFRQRATTEPKPRK